MKHYKSLFLLLLLVAAPVMGNAQTTLTQITSPDSEDLSDGGLYLIACKSGSNYGGFSIKKNSNMGDSTFVFWGYDTFKDAILKTVNGSHLIRLYRHDDNQYYVYDATYGYYLQQKSTNFKISSNPNDDSGILFLDMAKKTLGSSTNKLQIHLGDRIITFNTAKLYNLRTETNTGNDVGYALLYRIQDLTGYGTAVNAESDLTDLEGDSTVLTLERTFSSDRLNTLMVPFPIDHYKEVFGPQVQAFVPDEEDLENIAFKAVEGRRLEANTPYLLSGTFAQVPFLIPHTAVVLPNDYTNDQVTKVVNGVQFIGIYKDKELGNQDAYLLSNDKLYHCQNISSCHLGAYRWYITMEENAKSKAFHVDGNTISTSLSLPQISPQEEENTYDLSGRQTSSSQIHISKGIVLRQGKKIIIR